MSGHAGRRLVWLVIVAQATIRVHELERFTGVDTDGDGFADRVRVDFYKPRLSCPDAS